MHLKRAQARLTADSSSDVGLAIVCRVHTGPELVPTRSVWKRDPCRGPFPSAAVLRRFPAAGSPHNPWRPPGRATSLLVFLLGTHYFTLDYPFVLISIHFGHLTIQNRKQRLEKEHFIENCTSLVHFNLKAHHFALIISWSLIPKHTQYVIRNH